MTSSPASVALRVRDGLAPLGRPLAVGCLFVGYAAVALGAVSPATLDALLGPIPESYVPPIGYLVTFAYPAAYAGLELVAAAGEQACRAGRTRRDRLSAYLAVAFGERSVDHLLYLLFPLALLWGALSLLMGPVYAVPAWVMVAVAAVGVIVGNRYAWYRDSSDRES